MIRVPASPPFAVVFALLALASPVPLAAIGACSSGGSAPANAGDADAARGLGESCDPAMRAPCIILTDVCSVSRCDPSTRLCVRVAVDAGPTCSGGGPPPSCATSGDCDAGLEAGDSADGDAADVGDAELAPESSADAPSDDGAVLDGGGDSALGDAGDAGDGD